jgi:hypothetical protein
LDEQIDPICTDEAYDTKHCRQVILDQDTHAVIPLKIQNFGNIKNRIFREKRIIKTVKHLARAIWKKWSG